MNKCISPGTCSGELRIPSSKSVVHRLLICAALGEKNVRIRLNGLSKDTRATASCLSALGAEIQMSESAESDPYIALVKRLALNDKLDFDTAKILIAEYKKTQGRA